MDQLNEVALKRRMEEYQAKEDALIDLLKQYLGIEPYDVPSNLLKGSLTLCETIYAIYHRSDVERCCESLRQAGYKI